MRISLSELKAVLNHSGEHRNLVQSVQYMSFVFKYLPRELKRHNAIFFLGGAVRIALPFPSIRCLRVAAGDSI